MFSSVPCHMVTTVTTLGTTHHSRHHKDSASIALLVLVATCLLKTLSGTMHSSQNIWKYFVLQPEVLTKTCVTALLMSHCLTLPFFHFSVQPTSNQSKLSENSEDWQMLVCCRNHLDSFSVNVLNSKMLCCLTLKD